MRRLWPAFRPEKHQRGVLLGGLQAAGIPGARQGARGRLADYYGLKPEPGASLADRTLADQPVAFAVALGAGLVILQLADGAGAFAVALITEPEKPDNHPGREMC
jgi:hypothetical protein